MFQPLYIAATGLSALEDEMSEITDNLANAKTVAFKKGRAEMESLFYVEKSFKDTLADAMSDTDIAPVNVEYGTGVKISSTPRDFTQGGMEVTSNPLDIAIQGEGFLQYKMPDSSIAYSRAGNLSLDNEGNLVDPNGHILEPSIVIPEGTTSIVIRTDGTVLTALNNSTSYSEVGQISLARFSNPAGLKSLGQNLFQATEASGDAMLGVAGESGYGTINQYATEQSNVDVITEMMQMVKVQRVFDTITKAVQSYEAMLTSLERMKQ
jgi:flagellar basal-body rod protein FlgG